MGGYKVQEPKPRPKRSTLALRYKKFYPGKVKIANGKIGPRKILETQTATNELYHYNEEVVPQVQKMKRLDYYNQLIGGLNENKDVVINDVKYIVEPGDRHLNLVALEGDMTTDYYLGQIIDLLYMERELHLYYFLLIEPEKLVMTNEEQKQLLVALQTKKGVFEVTSKFEVELGKRFERYKTKFKEVIPTIDESVKEMSRVIKYRDAITKEDNLYHDFELLKEKIEKLKPTRINLEEQNKEGFNYWINNRYWAKIIGFLRNYSPVELIALILAVHQAKDIWLLNYKGKGKDYFLVKHELVDFFAIYLKIKLKTPIIVDLMNPIVNLKL